MANHREVVNGQFSDVSIQAAKRYLADRPNVSANFGTVGIWIEGPDREELAEIRRNLQQILFGR